LKAARTTGRLKRVDALLMVPIGSTSGGDRNPAFLERFSSG
jgi:hypothetical protein